MSDDELAKQQLRIKEMDRKSTFEATQSEMRHNKDALTTLRRENKELRSALQQAAKGSTVNSSAFSRKESELLNIKLNALRRALDDARSANDAFEREILGVREKTEDLGKEAQPILADDSPLTQKIRTLENRLDKSLIKHNEAMSIRRTYETILKRLRDERVGFDNQLAAIEKTLKAKEHDFNELQNMAHDAMHAKEIARAEVAQFKAAYAEERRQKKKELEERMAYVRQRKELFEKQERLLKQRKAQEEAQAHAKADQEDDKRKRGDAAHATVELRTEEEQERLQQYGEAFRRIKDVTRATNVEEVIAKFIAQEDTSRTLMDMTRDAQARIDALQTQRAELRRKVEESKYSGSGQLGSRRIVDEFEAHLVESRLQLDKAQKEFERTSKQLIAVKAGIAHLAEKLSTFRSEAQAPPATDENTVELLKHCEAKLQMLVDEVTASGDAAGLDVSQIVNVEIPAHNLRVKIALDAEDEEDDKHHRDGRAGAAGGDAEDADDDPHDRVALKQMSLSAVEREAKKARKRGRAKEGEGQQGQQPQ